MSSIFCINSHLQRLAVKMIEFCTMKDNIKPNNDFLQTVYTCMCKCRRRSYSYYVHIPICKILARIWATACYLFQNCFSAVRGRGGFNDHPTTSQAAASIAAISTNNFLRKESATSTSVENLNDDCVEIELPSLPSVPSEETVAEDHDMTGEYRLLLNQLQKIDCKMNIFLLADILSGDFDEVISPTSSTSFESLADNL